jgi:hypothetical protein
MTARSSPTPVSGSLTLDATDVVGPDGALAAGRVLDVGAVVPGSAVVSTEGVTVVEVAAGSELEVVVVVVVSVVNVQSSAGKSPSNPSSQTTWMVPSPLSDTLEMGGSAGLTLTTVSPSQVGTWADAVPQVARSAPAVTAAAVA